MAGTTRADGGVPDGTARKEPEMRFHRRDGVWLVLVVAVFACIAAPARADTVTEWNGHAVRALIANAGQSPTVSAVSLAMVHGAMYDAVNSIDRRYEPYLVVSRRARRGYSMEAAAATAAHHVLVALVPAQQADLDAAYAASLASVPAGRARDGGIAAGEVAAAAMLAERTGDGRSGPFRFSVGTAPGQWRPTPPGNGNDPNAWVAQVEPFLIPSADRFRSRGPDPLTGAAYARDLNEVKNVGSQQSTVRTADQADAARFWAGGYAPLIVALRQLAEQFRLGMADDARLFAMVYFTAADTGIACWADKARWLFWRPITAIREADTDGNPATEPDPEWTPFIATPPYPDHPSGLTAFSGAVTATLRDFFGTDRIPFTVTSANSGTTRSYASFSQALREGIDAQVWAGSTSARRTSRAPGSVYALRVIASGTSSTACGTAVTGRTTTGVEDGLGVEPAEAAFPRPMHGTPPSASGARRSRPPVYDSKQADKSFREHVAGLFA